MTRLPARPLLVALSLGAALAIPGPRPARAVVTRVVGWGDSITYGYYDYTSQPPANGTCWAGGIDPPETCGYVKRLNDRLNSTTYENPIWDIGVLNLGKGGESTGEALSRIDNANWACPCATLPTNPCPINSLKYWVCNGTIHNHDVFVLLEGTNDLTRNISVETVSFNLQALAQKAVNLGLQPLLATLTPRHKYTWFQYSCPPGSQRTIEHANLTVESLDSLILDVSTGAGWPYADLFGHFWKLKDHGLLNNYYQTWEWMKCDPLNPEVGSSGDPVGHPDKDGIDLMAFKFVSGYGEVYSDTIESHVKLLLPPRLTVTPPTSPTTGVPAEFSADLPDLGQTDLLRFDFDDGEIDLVAPDTSPFVQPHTYYVPGPYTVTVTAYHPNGGSRSVVVNISVGGVDLTIFRDGFESGDATAWSAVAP
jgi:lysophospholipase L1-like esterase